MNPVSQPTSPPPPQPLERPQSRPIDVVSAPSQTIPVRTSAPHNPFAMTSAPARPAPPPPPPTSPAVPTATTNHTAQTVVTPKPKHDMKRLWPVTVAVLAAIVLVIAATYAFRAKNPASDSSTSQSQLAAAKPITSSDLDQLSKSFGNLTNLDDAQDFSAEGLSNQAFGF